MGKKNEVITPESIEKVVQTGLATHTGGGGGQMEVQNGVGGQLPSRVDPLYESIPKPLSPSFLVSRC